MPRPLLEVAQELANVHRTYDPATHTIKLFNGTPGEIRRLEVSDAARFLPAPLRRRF